MSSIRFFIALFLSKLYLFVLKVLKKEKDDKPGIIACKLSSSFIKKIGKPKKIIAVTGTNGKTTTANMLYETLTKLGNNVSYNTWGANTTAGAARCFLDKVSLFNKNKADIAIIEMDELTCKEVFDNINLDYLIVTNIYRDSMHRNAHPYYIFNKINNAINSDTTLILNADDPISSKLHEDNRCIYFGIEKLSTDTKTNNNIVNDFVLCQNCNTPVKYKYYRFHHIGEYYCPNCGDKNKDRDCSVTKLDFENEKMEINYSGTKIQFNISNDNISNIYNILPVIMCLRELGYDLNTIKEQIDNLKVVSSRQNETIHNDIKIDTLLSKGMNAVATSRVCDYISKINDEKLQIIIIIDDTFDNKNGSEATCWIYDVDFELLNKNNIDKIIIGGVRHRDYILRLLLAGIPKDKIVGVQKEEDTYKYLDYNNIDKVIILHDVYSVTLANNIKNSIIKKLEVMGK